jgi:ribosomal protein L12E/L44/L45/RPP1/RPP2
MKNYSNPSRKPMMYGGMAKPKKKMVSGGRTVSDKDVETAARAVSTTRGVASPEYVKAEQKLRDLLTKSTGRRRVSDADKERMQKLIDSLPTGKDFDALIKKARKVMSTTDASTAKSYTPNDKKMYGGKAKKMAMGGKPMAKDPKTGKMMPTYAMDGKGKMMAGGKARKK